MVSISLAWLWVALDIWNDHLQLWFPINIALLMSEEGGSSSIRPISYLIGQLIPDPLLWLVDCQQRRVWSPISQVLILSWIRLDRMPVGVQQKPLPVWYQSPIMYISCIMDQHQYRYRWWNISGVFPATNMVYTWCILKIYNWCQKFNFSCFGRFPERSFYWGAPSPTLACSPVSSNGESTPPLMGAARQAGGLGGILLQHLHSTCRYCR